MISPCETQEHSDSQTSRLIREWLFRFGVEHKEDIAPRLPLWLEAFGGMRPETLQRLFARALRNCKFFPKVSDILEGMEKPKQAATRESAEKAWDMVLDLRRTRWSPDAMGGFYGGKPQLSPRVEQACRAAGVFREVESVNDLHVWARERFIESFLAWDDSEAGKHLLPDGEIKNLLEGCAVKMLPWNKPEENLPTAEERLRIADELSAAARKVLGIRDKMKFAIKDTAERREELRRQAVLIRAKYPCEARP